jgi:WD40 repeat protein
MLLVLPAYGQKSTKTLTFTVNPYKQSGNVDLSVEAAYGFPVTGLCLSPDNHFLVSGGYNEILIWDLHEAVLHLSLPLYNSIGHVRSVSFINDNQLVVAGGNSGYNGACMLVDLQKEKILWTYDRLKDMVTNMHILPHKQTIIVGSAIGELQQIHLFTGQLIRKSELLSSEITSIKVSPNEKYWCTSTIQGDFNLWSFEKDTLLFAQKEERR